MSVVIDGTTGVTAAAFDGAVDGADLTGSVAAARITTALNATGSAPIYACRAWVNFNGTGTVAIRASGNVSSITDNGTGDYTVNFTTAMPDANYAYSHSYSNEVNVQHTIGFLESMTAGSLRIKHFSAGDSTKLADKAFVAISVFR
jgi:hypothetical protein